MRRFFYDVASSYRHILPYEQYMEVSSMKIQTVSAPRTQVNAARMNGKLLLLYILLDMSASMILPLEDGTPRFKSIIPALTTWLRSMLAKDYYVDNLQITIKGFNARECITFMEEQFLSDENINLLEQQLGAVNCCSNTPLGEFICHSLDEIEDYKDRMKKTGIGRFQPIFCVITDEDQLGLDDAGKAISAMDTLLSENKIVFIPVGIGKKDAEFPILTRMLKCASNGEDSLMCKVISNSDDLVQYFRYVGQTVQCVNNKIYRAMSYANFQSGWHRP